MLTFHVPDELREGEALVRIQSQSALFELVADFLAEAAHHLRESLALADACAAPFERALTLLAIAELHAAEG